MKDTLFEVKTDFEFGSDVSEFSIASEDAIDVQNYDAFGIEPETPTAARPGSEEKVLMLSARYAAGLPLWHNSDCDVHGPRERELRGLLPEENGKKEVLSFLGDEVEASKAV